MGCGMRLAMYKPKLSQVPFADGGVSPLQAW